MAGEGKKLFREWEADYAARREENRRAREGAPAARPREAWPSEIAEANRHKPAGQDHGKEHSHVHDDGHSM
jgi:hypothetical protein